MWQSTGQELAIQTQLRREYSDRLVRGAFALCELRRRGLVKFSRAAEMWFDRQGLEQATSEPVARHKAGRFSGEVLDLSCDVEAVRGPVGRGKVRASVAGELAVRGTLTFAVGEAAA